ncbi:MAG: hypothetical protein ACRCZ0_07020 [Cetobacterium sp.]
MEKTMNFNDLMMERGTFKARGEVVAITGEPNKVFKSGWVGSSAEITILVNGTKQKVKVFGGVGKNEFKVNVFQLDGEGQISKDGEGKSIRLSINADQFNPTLHKTFDRKEVIEWGDRNAEGKATKIEHISELTDGRFANALLANKELLIGKKIGLSGNVKFKATQKFDKIESNIEVTQMVLLQPNEDGKYANDFFLIQSPMIVDKSSVGTITKDNGLVGYVPVYHKFLKPIQKNGREVKGRNVYIPFPMTVNENGFMMQSATDVSLEDREFIFGSKLEAKSQGAPLAIFTAMINYKSGMIEREITVQDLANDPVYGKFAKEVLDGTRDEDKFKAMYKAQNPATVKGEFKQSMDFLGVQCVKDIGDKIFGIAPESFEVYSLEKIKEETEIMNGEKAQVVAQAPQSVIPKVATTNTTDVAPPIANGISDISFEEDFPF